jgi:XTP/dITP diphosphohydrolase
VGDRAPAAGPSAVVATANPHKLEELRAALTGWRLVALGAAEYPEETLEGYAVNAARKARFGRSRAPGADWVLGEDSGIEVAALGGRPGVASARWADDGVTRLLTELGDAADRRARYVCALAAVGPNGAELLVEGTLEGAIVADGPRGDEGFGYDPIFVPAGETRTVAELGDAWKRLHSHRARAASALADRVAAGPTGV